MRQAYSEAIAARHQVRRAPDELQYMRDAYSAGAYDRQHAGARPLRSDARAYGGYVWEANTPREWTLPVTEMAERSTATAGGNEDGWSFWTRVYDQPELQREIDESNRAEGRPTVRQVRAACGAS